MSCQVSGLEMEGVGCRFVGREIARYVHWQVGDFNGRGGVFECRSVMTRTKGQVWEAGGNGMGGGGCRLRWVSSNR